MPEHTRRSVSTKKIAYIGVFAALSILFGYIETLIPFPFGIPGIKLGLANIMTVVILYSMGTWEAVVVLIVRILVVSMLFGSPYSMIYSLAGGVVSLLIMIIVKHLKIFSIIGVSIAGGLSHNIGQLLVAVFVVEEDRLMFYTPFLMISGAITGMIIGIVSKVIYERLTPQLNTNK